jgi:hypothetical protein
MGRRISLDRTILTIVEIVSQRLVLSPLAILLRPGIHKTLEMKKVESILSDSAQGEHQERLLMEQWTRVAILLTAVRGASRVTETAEQWAAGTGVGIVMF